MRDSFTITWDAPFSLDLTGVDPDIVYCVEVYNITCGVDDLVVGDCNVTGPRFIDNRLQQGYINRIIITPRSNGQDAQNGTSNTKEEMFTSLTDPRSVIISAKRSMVTATFQFRIKGTGVKAALYSLTLNTIDEAENVTRVKIFVQNANNTNLSIVQSLPRRRLWNYQVLALNYSQHPVTTLLALSTHDIQSVTASSPSPGLIRVTGGFISGSSATSILVIVYSTDNRNDIYYVISPLSTEGETLVTNISGLATGLYNVPVFVLEENGLPFIRSASTPRSMLVGDNRGGENGNFLVEYEVQLTPTGICITCTFLDSSTTGCVAVVHQRISQLSSSGLMNIKSSHKFYRSSDSNTAQECIPAVDLELYQIGVVGGRLNIRRQPNQGPSLAGPITGTIVCVVVATVVVAVVLFIVIHKRRAIHAQQHQQQQQQQQPGDSSSLKPLTTSPGKRQDEEAYDVLRGPPKTSASKEIYDEEAYSVLQREPLKTSASKAEPLLGMLITDALTVVML